MIGDMALLAILAVIVFVAAKRRRRRGKRTRGFPATYKKEKAGAKTRR